MATAAANLWSQASSAQRVQHRKRARPYRAGFAAITELG